MNMLKYIKLKGQMMMRVLEPIDILSIANECTIYEYNNVLELKNEFKKIAMEYRKNSSWLSLLDSYEIKVVK